MPARAVLGCAMLCALAGCAGVDARGDLERAREEIARGTGQDLEADPLASAAAGAQRAVLPARLTIATAQRAALLHNPLFQARLAEVGLARADLEQAGLLENPALGLLFLLPTSGGSAEAQASLMGSISGLWRRKARVAAAQAELDAAILSVARAAGELVADTREACWLLAVARTQKQLAGAEAELAAAQLAASELEQRAGVATASASAAAHSAVLAARLETGRAERGETAARRALEQLLGCPDGLVEVELDADLPADEAPAFDAERLLSAACRERPDVRASAARVRAAAGRLRAERGTSWRSVDLGLAWQRPRGGGSALLGPALEAELPLFDRGQARSSRAEYELARELHRHRALLTGLELDLRAAGATARSAGDAARLVAQELLPAAAAQRLRLERAFESGHATLPELLDARRRETQAEREALEVRAELARALSSLERAAGVPWERLVADQEP